MKIVLLQNVKNLGKIGEIKEVADGYARNFLLPKKIAEIATPEAVKKALKIQQKKEEEKNKEIERLQKLAKEIENKKIIIKAKEKNGKLFGSIGKKEIAEKLGLEIVEDMIELEENIKMIGEKEITVNLGENIKTKILVNIQGEK